MKSLSQDPKAFSVASNQLLYKDVVGEQVNPTAVVSVMEKSSKRNTEIADIITLVLECGFQ